MLARRYSSDSVDGNGGESSSPKSIPELRQQVSRERTLSRESMPELEDLSQMRQRLAMGENKYQQAVQQNTNRQNEVIGCGAFISRLCQ